jgi:hypothetical protein
MILFAIAYSIAEFIIVCIVIFQFFAALITGRVNEPLLKFANNLTTYVYQVFQFQTFNSEEKPFPFADWPDEATAENVWLQDPEPAASPAASEAEPTAPVQPPAPSVPAEPPAPASTDQPTPGSQQDVGDDTERGDDDRVR